MNLYTFKVEQFHIDNTRSCHQDTDSSAIGGFLFPDCDGFVAADGMGRTKSQWDKLIDSADGVTFRKALRYPGSNSPAGCGSNSDYTVTWSVTRETVKGSMRQFFKDRGLTSHPGVRSLG